MAKQQWNFKSFSNHIDPDKEEQLKRVKKVVDDQVKHILSITNKINRGNKERNLRKKSEAIELIEDFHQQYEKLYILYENLREKVKKIVDGEDDTSSPPPDSDVESTYWNGGNEDRESQDFEISDIEDALTCASGVTKVMNSLPGSPFSRSAGLGDILRDIEIQREKASKTNHMLVEIHDLEAQLAALKIEVSSLRTHNRRLEEQVEWKSHEAAQTQEKISRLQNQITEMDAANKDQEQLFSSSRKQFEDDKQLHTSKITELEAKAEGMQSELDSLKQQKSELEVRLFDETKQWSSKVEGLLEQIRSLQQQQETVNSYNTELKKEIEKKFEEISKYLLQVEALRNEQSLSEQQREQEKEILQEMIRDLQSEIESLSSIKSELQEQVKQLSQDKYQSILERAKLEEEVSELQGAIATRENELSTEHNKFKGYQTMMSLEIKSLEKGVESLTSKLEASEKERNNLHVELEASQNDNKLLQLEMEKEREQSKSQLEKITKTNILQVERKIEEMATEFRKQFEDQYRILSRRIRVAEQLQAENKEWYRKTRDQYEHDKKELKEMTARTATELKNVKSLTVTANELLTLIESKALKFEEHAAELQNRISKTLSIFNSANQWAIRKNQDIADLKDDLDILLVQLDEKEAEIFTTSEKVSKLEDKVRGLEKIIEEKEDEMLVLTEEKKEAIRQLCILIDYHKDRSDFYMNLWSDKNIERRKAF